MIRQQQWGVLLLLGIVAVGAPAQMSSAVIDVEVDVNTDRREINPLIYGVAGASPQQLWELNATWHRLGGNPTSRYNWKANASNRGSDWYFESVPDAGAGQGAMVDRFILDARAARAEPVITVPMGDWVARLGPGRSRLASFSILKYGPQSGADTQWFADAGTGLDQAGRPIRGNDPNDANVRVTADFQQAWVRHLAPRMRYYTLDNEPSLWFVTHRDAHPDGLTMAETASRTLAMSAAIKAADTDAHVLAPEEWGWLGFRYSGADQQWARAHGWRGRFPDRERQGGQDYLPWLLRQWRAEFIRTARRPVDTVSVHYYPEGGEFSRDVTPAMQRLRNRSTRALWDPAYRDESWIGEVVALVPRLRGWVDEHYVAGVPIALTEYNWGADHHMSGAMAQADVWGIFGREGLDMAARWGTPPVGSPTFDVMKLFRNYDGRRSTFGDVSVRALAPDPDTLAVFAAERRSDGRLTVMVLNKRLDQSVVARLRVSGLATSAKAERYQLAGGQGITRLPDVPADRDRLALAVPAQSVTLLVVDLRRSR
jgi:hypothetical protein